MKTKWLQDGKLQKNNFLRTLKYLEFQNCFKRRLEVNLGLPTKSSKLILILTLVNETLKTKKLHQKKSIRLEMILGHWIKMGENQRNGSLQQK